MLPVPYHTSRGPQLCLSGYHISQYFDSWGDDSFVLRNSEVPNSNLFGSSNTRPRADRFQSRRKIADRNFDVQEVPALGNPNAPIPDFLRFHAKCPAKINSCGSVFALSLERSRTFLLPSLRCLRFLMILWDFIPYTLGLTLAQLSLDLTIDSLSRVPPMNLSH
jgi:hypothetical protein